VQTRLVLLFCFFPFCISFVSLFLYGGESVDKLGLGNLGEVGGQHVVRGQGRGSEGGSARGRAPRLPLGVVAVQSAAFWPDSAHLRPSEFRLRVQ
jgi:hypothetical protein